MHDSLSHLLEEAKDRKVDTVRVAAFVLADGAGNGIPRYSAWVVVTAVLDWDIWTEWRLLVGRGYAEMTERGPVVPPRIAELLTARAREIRGRVAEAGLGVRHGMLAHDAEIVDGTLD